MITTKFVAIKPAVIGGEMNNKLKPCPFCGDSVEIEDFGSCLEITCCCSMSIQKCDYLTVKQRETFDVSNSKYSDEAEQIAIKALICMWNDRAK